MRATTRAAALATALVAVAAGRAALGDFRDSVIDEVATSVASRPVVEIPGDPGASVPTPLPGGAPLKTDCYGEWVVFGASGTSRAVTCPSADLGCHASGTRDCLFRAQVCFDDASNALYRGRCAAAPITMFALRGMQKDDVDAVDNWPAVLEAVKALGTECSSTSVCLPPIAVLTCTAPFDLVVPPALKKGVLRRGVRTFLGLTTAGRKRDRDRMRLVCEP